MIKNETDINLNNAKYFAGHSLGEYSALTASKSISFDQTIKLLNNFFTKKSNCFLKKSIVL